MHRYEPQPRILMHIRAAVNGQLQFGPERRRPETRRSRAAMPPTPLPPNIEKRARLYADSRQSASGRIYKRINLHDQDSQPILESS